MLHLPCYRGRREDRLACYKADGISSYEDDKGENGTLIANDIEKSVRWINQSWV